MKAKTLVVCSITNWVVQDFRDAKIADLEIIGDRGFDLPRVNPSPETAWWMPTEHAVKLRYSGLILPLVSPGSHWLSTVPTHLTGRSIVTETVEDTLSNASSFANASNRKIWIKPAEFKHQSFFAGLYTKEQIQSFNLPSNALLQWTDTILDIQEEHRFYVVDGTVVTGSEYLVDGVTYYDGATSQMKDDALYFAQYAAAELNENQPPAYTLDVAYDKASKSWIVLEGNPMFSSAIYGSNPAVVVDALLRCVNPEDNERKWLWKPDPYLVKKYACMRPLR